MSGSSLHRVSAGVERERWVELLLQADGSKQQVRSYLNDGELCAYREDERVVGVVLAIAREAGTTELKAVSVEPSCQGQGVGRRMLRAVVDDLRTRGVRRVLVGTASSAIGPIAF